MLLDTDLLQSFLFTVYLQTIAKKVQKADHFEDNGQWIVTTTNLDDNTEKKEKYDFVLVCNGHYYEPKVPKFPGIETFQGKVLHTHDYKDFRGFENKRILVIGLGNSAADVASELSHHASHVSRFIASARQLVITCAFTAAQKFLFL